MMAESIQLSTSRRVRRLRRSRGALAFTIMDAALATVIIGVSFVAVMQLMVTGTVANIDSSARTTGLNLARNVRESMIQKTYATLLSYHGASYAPPKDGQGNDLTDFADWKQEIAVQAVDPTNLTTSVTTSSPAAVRITVTVSRGTERVCDLSWYAFDATP